MTIVSRESFGGTISLISAVIPNSPYLRIIYTAFYLLSVCLRLYLINTSSNPNSRRSARRGIELRFVVSYFDLVSYFCSVYIANNYLIS